ELATLIAVDTFAVVRPLVAAAHGHERALVALAASDEVRVFELAMGRLSPAAQLVGEVPRLGDRGAWSQLKMQHHRQWHVDSLPPPPASPTAAGRCVCSSAASTKRWPTWSASCPSVWPRRRCASTA